MSLRVAKQMLGASKGSFSYAWAYGNLAAVVRGFLQKCDHEADNKHLLNQLRLEFSELDVVHSMYCYFMASSMTSTEAMEAVIQELEANEKTPGKAVGGSDSTTGEGGVGTQL